MIVLLILLTAILTAAVVWFFSYRAGFEHGYAEGWQVALERGRRFGIMQAIDIWKTKAGGVGEMWPLFEEEEEE